MISENSAIVLFTNEAGNSLCAQLIEFNHNGDSINLSSGNCVNFSQGWELLASSTGGFVVSINETDIYALGPDQNKKIGSVSKLTPLQFISRDNFLGWVDQSIPSNLNIAEFTNLNGAQVQTLNNHCVLNTVSGVSGVGIPVVCHNYPSAQWAQSSNGEVGITLHLYTADGNNSKITEIKLNGLNQFRYTKQLWFDGLNSSNLTLEAVLGDDLGFRIFNNRGTQINEFESGLSHITNINAEDIQSGVSIEEDPMNNYFGQYNKMNIPVQGLIWRFIQDSINFKTYLVELLAKLTSISSWNLATIQ